eukprot:Platyproteum_vivax@DN4318_c0_g1_i1.p1
MFQILLYVLLGFVAFRYVEAGCASYYDSPNYVCAGIEHGMMSFYRNYDSRYYFLRYNTVQYYIDMVEVNVPNDALYKFDVFRDARSNCITSESPGSNLITSRCTVPRWTGNGIDTSIEISVIIQLQNGGTQNNVRLNDEDIWMTIELRLPPLLHDPAATVIIRSAMDRVFPRYTGEYFHLNVNNMSKTTVNQSVAHGGGGASPFFLVSDGMTRLETTTNYFVEKGGPNTTLTRQVNYVPTVQVAFWGVKGHVPGRLLKTFEFTGTEAQQLIRSSIQMRIGLWRNGRLHMLGLVVGICILGLVGVACIIAIPIFCCFMMKKKKDEAERKKRQEDQQQQATGVYVVGGQMQPVFAGQQPNMGQPMMGQPMMAQPMGQPPIMGTEMANAMPGMYGNQPVMPQGLPGMPQQPMPPQPTVINV